MLHKRRREDNDVVEVHWGELTVDCGQYRVDGPLVRYWCILQPNGMHVKTYVPKYVVNVLLSLSFGAIRICEYPEFASRVLKTFDSHSEGRKKVFLRMISGDRERDLSVLYLLTMRHSMISEVNSLID